MENVYEMVAIVSSWVYLLLIWFSDVQLGLTYGAEPDMEIVAGTAGTPAEPFTKK
jgi:hypothetical protein